jgi:hypothetical protein
MIQPKQATEGAQKPLRIEKVDGRVKITPSRQNFDRIVNEDGDRDVFERFMAWPVAFQTLFAQICVCGFLLVVGAIAWALWLRR